MYCEQYISNALAELSLYLMSLSLKFMIFNIIIIIDTSYGPSWRRKGSR
jgi:hypothetical protein